MRFERIRYRHILITRLKDGKQFWWWPPPDTETEFAQALDDLQQEVCALPRARPGGVTQRETWRVRKESISTAAS